MSDDNKVVSLRERQLSLAKREQALRGGGNSGDDGGMERVAKLEAIVERIESDVKELKDDVRALRADVSAIRTTDFRLLFGAIIGVALGLAGVMAKGFHWL